MKGLFLVLLVVASSAAAQEKQIKLSDGSVVSQSTYNEMVARVEGIREKVGEDAYRKYSDGSVMYLGKILHMKYGILPKPATNATGLIELGYKILDLSMKWGSASRNWSM